MSEPDKQTINDDSKQVKKVRKFLVEIPQAIQENALKIKSAIKEPIRKRELSKESLSPTARILKSMGVRKGYKSFPKVEHTKSRLLKIQNAELEYKSYGVTLPKLGPESNFIPIKSLEILNDKIIKSMKILANTNSKSKSQKDGKQKSSSKSKPKPKTKLKSKMGKSNEESVKLVRTETEKVKSSLASKSDNDSEIKSKTTGKSILPAKKQSEQIKSNIFSAPKSLSKSDWKSITKASVVSTKNVFRSVIEKRAETTQKTNKEVLKPVESMPSHIEVKKVPVEDMFNLGITTFTEEDEVYCRKIPKYKEIKHYIKGEVLGRGKFGVVREFVDKTTLKRYAGKILTKRQIQRNHLGRQVSKELCVMFHLNHRNILRAYDLFQNDKKLYIFLEFCWGELAEFMHHYKMLPKCQSKSYFIQVIEGLDYIHSRGIIHRDIKPENILLNNTHEIKLADFGCIQEIDFFAADDLVSGNDGTPLYHPPEMFEEKILEYSGSKIDIWAAGGILYQMLTGSPAFVEGPGDMADVVIKRIRSSIPNYDVPIIKNDILLLQLFQRIFEKDFTQRATICEIRNHSWVKNRCAVNSLAHFRPYPIANQKVDSYRSITVITRIHEKYNPSKDNKLYVDFKTFELSKQVRPLIRGTRVETKKFNRKICAKTFI